jgi:4-hydroxy-tetrahydrodipicolinate synthase
LRGVIPPLVTPLSGPDALDEEALERLIEHVVAGGVAGVFLLGTTGEGASLAPAVRRRLVERATRLVRRRVAVLAGVTDNSFSEMVRYARHAADCGADAVVATTPYFTSPDQDELHRYVRQLAHASPLPIFLYNMPRLTKTWFERDTVQRLIDCEQVVGIKDSAGELPFFREMASLARQRPDWSLLVGPEHLIVEALQIGGHGCVAGGANVWPQLIVELYQAVVADDRQRIAALQQRSQSLQRMYDSGGYAVGVTRSLKASLELLGICSSRLAEPFAPCSPENRQRIAELLHEHGLLAA